MLLNGRFVPQKGGLDADIGSAGATLMKCTETPSAVESARKNYLRSGVEAPNLATVKDFTRFYITTNRPQLALKLTVDSINTVAE